MMLRRFLGLMLLVVAGAAQAQPSDEPEPRLGPALRGHRNDGFAAMLAISSAALGTASLATDRADGLRGLAILTAATGLVSIAGGAQMREADSANRLLATAAIAMGGAASTIAASRLIRLRHSKTMSLSPTATPGGAERRPRLGFVVRLR